MQCAHVFRFESRQVVSDHTFTNVSGDVVPAKSLGLKADRVQMISLLQMFQRTHRNCLPYSFLNKYNIVILPISNYRYIAQGNVFCEDAKTR